MTGLIFVSGILKTTPELLLLLEQAELIIAADGGANHCSKLGIIPDILVGDLDSINETALAQCEQEDTEIQRYPVNKDATDLELALDLAREKGASTVWLAGALGGRWDMSLSNIMVGASDKYEKTDIRLLGEDCTMHIMRPQKTYVVDGRAGQTVSLLPLGGDVAGIDLTGFTYPLTNHTIRLGNSLGLSNVLTREESTVRFSEGTLLCIQLLSAPA